MRVDLHGKQALKNAVNIDTTVQEKNITYPTDAKKSLKTALWVLLVMSTIFMITIVCLKYLTT